jgi:hypothetical protein
LAVFWSEASKNPIMGQNPQGSILHSHTVKEGKWVRKIDKIWYAYNMSEKYKPRSNEESEEGEGDFDYELITPKKGVLPMDVSPKVKGEVNNAIERRMLAEEGFDEPYDVSKRAD